jgi:hypothetical protein
MEVRVRSDRSGWHDQHRAALQCGNGQPEPSAAPLMDSLTPGSNPSLQLTRSITQRHQKWKSPGQSVLRIGARSERPGGRIPTASPGKAPGRSRAVPAAKRPSGQAPGASATSGSTWPKRHRLGEACYTGGGRTLFPKDAHGLWPWVTLRNSKRLRPGSQVLGRRVPSRAPVARAEPNLTRVALT